MRRARMTILASLLATSALTGSTGCADDHWQPVAPTPPDGTLHPLVNVESSHPWFTDAAGNAVYLTGSHTWTSLQDWGLHHSPLDYGAFLDMLASHGHNFTKLWVWEQPGVGTDTTTDIGPIPWMRSNVAAESGRPRYDLNRLDPAYFRRLHDRVEQAATRGIYVGVMLFQEYGEWASHPFHADNNVNGISAASDDPRGNSRHTLENPAVTAVQEAYVREVVRTLEDLPNVLYEIGNEHQRSSLEWQRHMIGVVRRELAAAGRSAPVGITSTGGGGNAITNDELRASDADWISPRVEDAERYDEDPPAAGAHSRVMVDSDHLAGLLGTRDSIRLVRWVWKSFLRGNHPVMMDPWHHPIPGHEGSGWNDPGNAAFAAGRRAMGEVRAFASTLPLATMVPRPELCDGGYCLADRDGGHLVVYIELSPGRAARMLSLSPSIELDLTGHPGSWRVEWFAPHAGRRSDGDRVVGGAMRRITSPIARDVVAHLTRSAP